MIFGKSNPILGQLDPFRIATLSFGDGDGAGGGDGQGGDGQGGDGQGGQGGTDWRAELDPAIKDHPALTNLKSVADLAKSHVEVQKLVGREKLPMPAKPYAETPDEYNMVFDRLGRPSDPNAYKTPTIDYAKLGVPVPSEEEVKNFKTVAHKIGLMPHQVEALMTYHAEGQGATLKSMTEQNQVALQSTEAELRKEYGKAYDGNIELARRVLVKFGDEKSMELVEGGLGNDPRFIKLMVNISKNFGEDGQVLGEGDRAGVMTPDEAQAEIKSIQADASKDPKHPYRNKLHPEYRKMTDRVSYLFQMAYPDTKKQA